MNDPECNWYKMQKRDVMFCAILALLALSLFLAAKIQVLPGMQGPVTFDGKYYSSIAEDGYAFNGDIEKKQNIAYLPLTAAEIGIARFLVPGSNELVEVMLAGSLILFGTLLGIFSLSSGLAGPAAARLATLFWAGSPMAFYNFVGYSEPTFAMLCVFVFLALYRNALWTATILAAVAMLGRPHAVVLAGFVVFAIAHRAAWRPSAFLRGPGALQLSILVAPLMAFATWQAIKFGDATAYVNALEAWRRGSFLDGSLTAGPAFLYFFAAVSAEASALSHWTTLVASVSLAVITGALALSAGGPRKVLAFYVAMLAFLFLSASFDATNIARHAFFMFPWAMLIAIAIARLPGREFSKYLALSPALVVAAIINWLAVLRYYNGQWVS